jgi:hypothetical protein
MGKSTSMLKRIWGKLSDNYLILNILLAIIVIVVPIQHYFFTSYNNFTIFQHSSFHFFQKVNLYLEYPNEYYDVFLYSPVFSILIAPVAYLPTLLSMVVWVVLIGGLYYVAVRLIPLEKKAILFILYFTLIELITSVQNLQTNSLIAASILFTFVFLERKSTFKSSFFVNLGFLIKVYGAVSGAFYILKSPRIKSFIYLLISFLILAGLPLLYYSPAQFVVLYKQWFAAISSDHDNNLGLSVMAIMTKDFKLVVPIYYTQLFGVLMLLVTMFLIAVKKSYEDVKYLFLAYIMIWVVIFNQAAESSTYIIASTGVAIWYVNSKKTVFDKILIITTFILTVLSPSDIFPVYIKKNYVDPYVLKAVGPILIFIKIQVSLIQNYVKACHNSSALQSA